MRLAPCMTTCRLFTTPYCNALQLPAGRGALCRAGLGWVVQQMLADTA